MFPDFLGMKKTKQKKSILIIFIHKINNIINNVGQTQGTQFGSTQTANN